MTAEIQLGAVGGERAAAPATDAIAKTLVAATPAKQGLIGIHADGFSPDLNPTTSLRAFASLGSDSGPLSSGGGGGGATQQPAGLRGFGSPPGSSGEYGAAARRGAANLFGPAAF